MFSSTGIKPYLTEDLVETVHENKHAEHNKTYSAGISFKDSQDVHIGELTIYFIVTGYGFEGSNGNIDVHFWVPFLLTEEPEKYMEEAEAMQFIFINFASEIQDVIDGALDALYDHWDEGTPLKSLFEKE
ncbi:hypothetical protein [Domibacillus epiphyticus]|uniref:Uncharacterized protein n=1 Tax=Domibacillus epiphyticus TaxID=1714355 RepID=A0A1V2A5P6_9BACI|nr:hypothetical protein [Domibacillus epiphyticus]OMP66313.1 hypothetical protein BTO28_12655 [Domibacillus epiphyticus]